jgi:hypothetical protein
MGFAPDQVEEVFGANLRQALLAFGVSLDDDMPARAVAKFYGRVSDYMSPGAVEMLGPPEGAVFAATALTVKQVGESAWREYRGRPGPRRVVVQIDHHNKRVNASRSGARSLQERYGKSVRDLEVELGFTSPQPTSPA